MHFILETYLSYVYVCLCTTSQKSNDVIITTIELGRDDNSFISFEIMGFCIFLKAKNIVHSAFAGFYDRLPGISLQASSTDEVDLTTSN